MCVLYVAVILDLPADISATSEKREAESMSNVRLHMFRMHPFLKHKLLSRRLRNNLFVQTNTTRHKRHINFFPEDKKVRRDGQDADSSKHNFDCLLREVLNDIAAIKRAKEAKLQAACSLNGSWYAEVAGRHVDIAHAEYGPINIKLRKPVQPHCKGFMGTRTWNATGKIPFKHKANFVILIATKKRDKRTATFMGECLVCRDKELVQGSWLIARHSRDCENRGANVQVVGDVWRKDTLANIKEQRLKKLNKTSSTKTP